MSFVKRRISIKKVSKGQWAALVGGAFVCILAGVGARANAQGADIGEPQKQGVTFTFALGSSELSERYGGNATAMTQFNQLIRQVAGSSAAHIDSIVVASFASASDQLGSAEVAERRIDAVKAYIEPVIRQSQLRQAVVVTGNVVMKNNIMMPQQMLGALKRVTVTVYMNGVLTADAGRGGRTRGVGADEQRYMSPFGNGDTDVFGRSTAGRGTAAGSASTQRTTSTVVAPTVVAGAVGSGDVFTQRRQQQAQQQKTQSQQAQQQPQQTTADGAAKEPALSGAERQLQQQVNVLQQQVEQLQRQLQLQQQQQVTPVVPTITPEHPTTTTSTPTPTTTGSSASQRNVVDAELQRYIDSLAATINMDERSPIAVSIEEQEQQQQQEREVATAPVVPLTPAKPVETQQQPQAPEITTEEPCPEGRDPEIDDLILRMLQAQEQGQPTTVEVPQPVQQPTTEVQPVQQPQQTQQQREVIAFEVVTTGTETEETVVAETKPAKEPKEQKVKPVKEPKAKPVKPVKAPREPMILVRPLVAAKTNLVYWAGVAANLEAEFYFAERWSASIEGVYTNWNMNLYKKHYAANEISPEVRYWFARRVGEYRGVYLGVYGHLGQFDYMFKNQETGNTGDYYGAGLSVGAYLPFTRHFGMEIGVRGGWIHAGNYDRYYYDAPQDKYIYKSSHTKNYFGLTGAKVSLVYRFGLGRQ